MSSSRWLFGRAFPSEAVVLNIRDSRSFSEDVEGRVITFSPRCRTLRDMSEEEVEALEASCGARVSSSRRKVLELRWRGPDRSRAHSPR